MSSNESFGYRFSDESEKIPGCSGPFTLTGKDLTMRISQNDLHTVFLSGRGDFQIGFDRFSIDIKYFPASFYHEYSAHICFPLLFYHTLPSFRKR
jgi:hypothetical protein